MEIKYYNDDKENGIIYDWAHIMKEFKKLKVPKHVYDVTKLPITQAKYFNLLSERSTGKTTNLLLLGMICNRDYGTTILYIRKNEKQIMNKVHAEIFNTIRDFGYIEKLTNGRWNSCYYYASRWHYCNVDGDGNIIEKNPECFMRCLAVNKRDDYKSGDTYPRGDFIIYDEYISDLYFQNEFVHFADLVKTFIRDRISPVIFMLANTIDKHSEYFAEMEIYDEVQLIEPGKHELITTERGTKIYVELIKDGKEIKRKQMLNSLFFGFKNPRFSSITGDGWAISNYPHIESGYKTIQHGIYIEYHEKFLELEFVKYPEKGIFINIHRASRVYDDSVIYSNCEIKDSRYRFHMGDGSALDKFINYCIINHRILFHDNSCGTIFFNHLNSK